MQTKTCRYCGNRFKEIDFLSTFMRMVTCGSESCTIKRRLERVRKRR